MAPELVAANRIHGDRIQPVLTTSTAGTTPLQCSQSKGPPRTVNRQLALFCTVHLEKADVEAVCGLPGGNDKLAATPDRTHAG